MRETALWSAPDRCLVIDQAGDPVRRPTSDRRRATWLADFLRRADPEAVREGNQGSKFRG
jgi:hypothetical protein